MPASDPLARAAVAAGPPTAAASTAAAATGPQGAPADLGLVPVDREALLTALSRPIDPVRVGPLYTAGLLLVAVTMVLLPLVYVGLIVLVAKLLWWHVVHDVTIFKGGGNAKGKLLVYLAPIIVGGVLLLFMVKPLFARRGKADKPLSLSRDREPLLFQFVDRLCVAVGSPAPVRIDVDCQVNASAAFRHQGPFAFLTRQLVLTIGLPLAAGLDVRQFAGVLAHEFGHFAQGTGMRVTYVIRSINRWFARVVYERDAWDEMLAGSAGEWGAGGALIVLTARLMVWVTRRVLWCLMMVGHGISSLMLRQMEFDADRCEARVAGAVAFEQTTQLLASLNLGQAAAMNELQASWRERRLCDDLPALVRRRERELPDDLRRRLHDAHAKARTGWFDSHPCDADRVAAARRGNPPGIVRVDAPAAALFADFGAVCRRVTAAFYNEVLGDVPAGAIVPTESLTAGHEERKRKNEAMGRYFQGLAHPVRPTFFDPSEPPPASPDAAAETILAARSDLAAKADAARRAAKAWERSMGRLIGAIRGEARTDAGLRRWKPQDLGLEPGDPSRLPAVRQEQAAEAARARAVLDPLLAAQMNRLRSALYLADLDEAATMRLPSTATPPTPGDVAPDDDFGAYGVAEQPEAVPGSPERLTQALATLGRHAETTEAVRVALIRLNELLGQLQPEGNDEKLIDRTLSASRQTVSLLGSLRDGLAVTPYPYRHGERGMTLGRFVVPTVPEANAVGAVCQAADVATDAAYELYSRIVSDLAERAERTEIGLGLPPLVAPPAEDEPAEDSK
jgi:Zn-dependent protease with chaperone function